MAILSVGSASVHDIGRDHAHIEHPIVGARVEVDFGICQLQLLPPVSQSEPRFLLGALPVGITVAISITTSVDQRSPAWHRAARRKRARARYLLRATWPTSPARVMAGAARLQSHHGSAVPAGFDQSWQCHVCEETNSMNDTTCKRCGHAAGFQKPPPGGMWRCVCGLANSHYYRFCRACQTSVGQRVRFPQQKGKGQAKEQTHEPRQRWAPYLAAHPGCPLMPPPPGRPLMTSGPPVVWRPVGNTDLGHVSANPPPPPPGVWNQSYSMNQTMGQQPATFLHAGHHGRPPTQRSRQGAPVEGKGGACFVSAQGPSCSANKRAGPGQVQCLAPQQQLMGDQSQWEGMAHSFSIQPFPPPVPRASPEQLLQEIRQGLSSYELSRLVAIEATQRVLSKHLSEMSAIEDKMGVLFVERADMQKRCHTEHLRLIQLFMAGRTSESVPSPSVNTVPGAFAHLPESSPTEQTQGHFV